MTHQNYDIETLLSQLLLSLSECENQVETSRQELCQHPNFDPYSSFLLLQNKETQKISQKDLKIFLSKRSMAISREYLELLITQYDSNQDSFLSLDEFSAFILSSEDEELSKAALSRKVSPTLYIESLISRHIELECNWQGRLQYQKRRLFNDSDFDPVSLYRLLCGENEMICRKSVYYFLSSFSEASLEDCDRIIKRVDTDCDGLLSYQEFLSFVLPVERKSRRSTQGTERLSLTRPETFQSPRRKRNKKSVNFSSEEADQDICKVFSSQIEIEARLDKQKKKLTSHLDFSFDELVKLLDRHQKKFVTVSDIEGMLRDLQVDYQIEEIELLFRDYTGLAKLNYRQAKDLFVPLSWIDRKRVGLFDEGYRIFSADTLSDLIDLLKLTLSSQRDLENLRNQISPFLRSRLNQIFQDIDQDNSSLVSLPDLRGYLSKSNLNYRESKVRLLFKRYSKSIHKEFNQSDFLDELTPKLR